MVELRNSKRPGWATLQRARQALACGLAGWVVSFGMIHWGGALARHLPDQLFHTAAFWGALVAGFILASGFGRPGRWGWMLAGFSAVLATVLGATIAAGTMGLMFEGDPTFIAPFGIVAIADGATSPLLMLTWIAAMVGVDAVARWIAVPTAPPATDIFD